MNASPDRTVLKFGPFELDAANEQLRKSGSTLKLPPQPFKVLSYLANHAGQLVTRQDLRDHVWDPATVVDFEQGLNHCIKQIRLALDDDADRPQFIETVPKRGYRFIAEVRDTAVPVAQSSARRWRWLLAATAVTAIAAFVIFASKTARDDRGDAPAATVTLAVLPFEVLNRPEEIGYLATAIPDAITARLARAGQIRVRPTAAVLHADLAKRGLAETGRTLAADYLLTGTLQEIGDDMRINLQLVRSTDTVSLWAEHYDLPHSNLLTLEDAVAEKVAGALRIPVGPTERARLYRKYTGNPQAYESYLRGRSELVRYTKDSTLAAIKSFDTALQLDPNYALAHAGLASASAQMHLRFAAADEVAVWGARARREAQLALDLDPDLAEVHEALAAVYGQTDFDWPRTIDESRRALALNPSLPLPHYYLARAYFHYGLLELIEGEVRAGLDIDPVNRLDALRLRGTAAIAAGRYEEAKRWLEEAHNLSGPTVSDWYFAQALYYSGERHRAEELLRALHGSAQGEQRARATLASFLAARGHRDEARSLIDRALATGYMDHHVAYSLGATYAQLGESARAMPWLGKAADTGFPCYPWFSHDPLLQPLRSTADFNSLLTRLQEQTQAARVQYH